MDDLPRRSPPAGWLKSIEAGRADVAAGHPGVPVETVNARLSELQARLRAEAEPDTESSPANV